VGKLEKLLAEKDLKWPETKVKTLGVWLSTYPNITLKENLNEKSRKVKSVLNC